MDAANKNDAGIVTNAAQVLPDAVEMQTANDSGMEVDSFQAASNDQPSACMQMEVEPSPGRLQCNTSDAKNVQLCNSSTPSSDLFACVAQDRILGLIGALMPPNRQVISRHFS